MITNFYKIVYLTKFWYFQDIDYIIWTGDLPPHDIWNQTKDSNLDIIRETTRLILEAFPDTPVFPAVGNHESVPAGRYFKELLVFLFFQL